MTQTAEQTVEDLEYESARSFLQQPPLAGGSNLLPGSDCFICYEGFGRQESEEEESYLYLQPDTMILCVKSPLLFDCFLGISDVIATRSALARHSCITSIVIFSSHNSLNQTIIVLLPGQTSNWKHHGILQCKEKDTRPRKRKRTQISKYSIPPCQEPKIRTGTNQHRATPATTSSC